MKIIPNPFQAGSEIRGSGYQDRLYLTEILSEKMKNGENVIIHGKYRSGKTSLSGNLLTQLSSSIDSIKFIN